MVLRFKRFTLWEIFSFIQVNLLSKRLKEGSVNSVNKAVQEGKNVLVGFTSASYQKLVEDILYQVVNQPCGDNGPS